MARVFQQAVGRARQLGQALGLLARFQDVVRETGEAGERDDVLAVRDAGLWRLVAMPPV